MGLDGVEIVMKVEETFGIKIEDPEAEAIRTPRELIELVMGKVAVSDPAACLTQRAFHRIRASLVRRLGYKRAEIEPESLMSNVFPKLIRKPSVEQVLADVGVSRDIVLLRPDWARVLIWFITSYLAVFFTAFLMKEPGFFAVLSPFDIICVSPFFTGVLFFLLAIWVAHVATRSMRTEFPRSLKTVGQFSRWIVATAPESIEAPTGQWSREQVSIIIRGIVIDILGCEKEYREDARFVEDLKMS